MNKFLSVILNAGITKSTLDEILKCNEKTSEYGLKFTVNDVNILMTTRKESLTYNGRVEFGAGIIKKIIEAFCDSPYISQYNYLETIDELINIFYYYKNETLDFIGDDELIENMKNFFDGSCEGSVELLQNREMYRVECNVKKGIDNYWNINEKSMKEDDFYEEDY